MTPEEENLTVAQKTAARMELAAKVIIEAADKAKANGLTTRAEAKADKRSINATTIVATVIAVLGIAASVSGGVWFVVTLMIGPMQKQLDALASVTIEAQKDIRELYRVSTTERSPRLEKPPAEVPK